VAGVFDYDTDWVIKHLTEDQGLSHSVIPPAQPILEVIMKKLWWRFLHVFLHTCPNCGSDTVDCGFGKLCYNCLWSDIL